MNYIICIIYYHIIYPAIKLPISNLDKTITPSSVAFFYLSNGTIITEHTSVYFSITIKRNSNKNKERKIRITNWKKIYSIWNHYNDNIHVLQIAKTTHYLKNERPKNDLFIQMIGRLYNEVE